MNQNPPPFDGATHVQLVGPEARTHAMFRMREHETPEALAERVKKIDALVIERKEEDQ